MAIILGRKPGGAGGGGTPSGPAGGDLSGTYPNPTVTNLIPKTLLDAKGDLIAATAADTAARLAVGTNGRPLTADSAAAAGVSYQAQELDYAQITSNVNITATVEASATTLVTANAVVFDGATPVLIEFYTMALRTPSPSGGFAILNLWDGASDIGQIAIGLTPAAVQAIMPVYVGRRLTPSAASHTYSIRGWVSATTGTPRIDAGAGGAGTASPAFIRISRVAA